MNEIKLKYSERKTFIIRKEVDWDHLKKEKISGCILIPFFYAESIDFIRNNTNIFVYGEDEPCYNNDKLILRKRTKANLIHSLEIAGLGVNEAYRLVEKTHGLYAPMKKYLFDKAFHSNPTWKKNHSGTVMAALLCGKWTEADGDIRIFEKISGMKYSDSEKELKEYIHIENPFIVEMNAGEGKNRQLASVEDAWEELDTFIDNELWEKFINLFYEVLIDSEPIFEYPLNKHFEASIYAKRPDLSPSLKSGMIRTLLMYAHYRGHIERQREIDEVVGKVLGTITTKERWGYISQYIMDLCEASPKAVMQKLENEFQSSTGLIDLFGVKDNNFITSRYYYTNVLWAVEQLLQQKDYVKRAVKWLWNMNEHDISYSISNSPKAILENIFCAWFNVSALSVDNKIKMAKDAVKKYSNAWDIISSKLPKGGSETCSPLNQPKYRKTEGPDDLNVFDVNRTYIEYLWICINSIKSDADKWIRITGHLQYYAEEIEEEALNRLVADCQNMDDFGKFKIKNEIRSMVYKHRLFAGSEWSIEEEKLKKYENLLSCITLKEREYEFIYLFSSRYNFPLLHPFPYSREDNDGEFEDSNEKQRSDEIKAQLSKFVENNYSIERLIELVVEKSDSNNLGEVLSEFFCDGKYNEEVMNLL